MNFIIYFIVFFHLFTFIFSASTTAFASETILLNGNVYAANIDGTDDILTFQDGTFQSNLFSGQGFINGEYTTVRKNKKIRFSAKIVSPNEDEVVWTGIVSGDTIRGSYLHTKKGWFIFGDTTRKRNYMGKLIPN